ncbi:MAG: hypothetical protein L6Q35_03565 [Phycisphaerales bacterium]|nr:hypothetical protein [Phycisphaerales bacterium]
MAETVRDMIRRARQSFADNSAAHDGSVLQEDTDGRIIVRSDFRAGEEDDTIRNAVDQTVFLIAGIRDRIKSQFKGAPNLKARWQSVFESSKACRIVQDLSNYLRHGQYDRHTYSGFKPRIEEPMKPLRLTPNPGERISLNLVIKGGKAGFQFGGARQTSIIRTAIVKDESGTIHGDLRTLCEQALDAWEKLVSDLEKEA